MNINYGNTVGFGCGEFGLLGPIGADDNDEVLTPRLLVDLLDRDIIQVACGSESSLALTMNGEVLAWGGAWIGGGDIKSPVRIEGFRPYPYRNGPNNQSDAFIKQIAAGRSHFLALSSEGDVYVWGYYRDRGSGQILRHTNMDNDNESSEGSQDRTVHHLAGMKAKRISCGDNFCAALLQDNTLVTWGIGTSGRLARQVSSDEAVNDYLRPEPPLWDRVSMPGEKQKVLSMACGYDHLLVVTEDHAVYSSGSNTYGQLGHGDKVGREILTEITHLRRENIADVSAGDRFSYFVDQTRTKIFACGKGDCGQLGIPVNIPIPHYYSETRPRRVPLIYDSSESTDDLQIIEKDQPRVRDISCGQNHVLALTDEGDAYSWGRGDSGKCGHGIGEGVKVRPKKLESKLIKKFLCLSAGDDLSLAVATVDEKHLCMAKQMAAFVHKENPGRIGEVAPWLEKIIG